jgi:hypothetical protein
MSAPAGQASWTYAVARPFDPVRVAGLRGVDGAEVHLVPHRELVAVVSALPAAELAETALRDKLEQPKWLEAAARAHHAVVAAVAAGGATLPFRLATIHHGDDRVAAVLRRGYRRLCAALDRLEGRIELGVKVYADREAMVAAATAAALPGPAGTSVGSAGPGRDFLRRRMERRRLWEDAGRRAAAVAEGVAAALARLADDSRLHRPQDPRLSGIPGENVLNAVYLVDAHRAGALGARAERLVEGVPGVWVRVTGPWPPYSFALPGEEEPA